MKMTTGWARLAPDARGGVMISHFLYRRREFILFLGAAAVILPLAARAQRSERVRRIGLIMGGTEENDPESQARITAFKEGLAALGWTEGRNIRIDYRFGGGDPDRIGNIVAELVRSGPDLIVANTTAATAALKQATNTIPVVFAVVNNPVGQGLISSLARPGGNITGFTYADFTLLGKWLEMLKQIAPGVRKAILLFNPQTVPFLPCLPARTWRGALAAWCRTGGSANTRGD
jgi:putative ABC transport system substrate-binding protein